MKTCQYCFGEKFVYNGKDWIKCPYCKGTGECDDFTLYPNRIFPDDRVQFNEEQFYSDE